MSKKSNVPQDIVEVCGKQAQDGGPFLPVGRGNELSSGTNRGEAGGASTDRPEWLAGRDSQAHPRVRNRQHQRGLTVDPTTK